MFELDLVIDTASPMDECYVVTCWKCAEKFDSAASSWCECDAKLRTIECPHCGSCFCLAPLVYRQKFWSTAPKTLREHNGRFRLPTRDDGAATTGQTGAPGASSVRRPHVLIVDDEEAIRSLAACYVEQIGYEVTVVSSPEEALIMAGMDSYDVVLTDALMPKMDGRELCRKLKDAHGDRMKVVIMTSLYTARHFRNEALHVFKADEYLSKPLRYDELREALHRVAPLAPANAGAIRQFPSAVQEVAL